MRLTDLMDVSGSCLAPMVLVVNDSGKVLDECKLYCDETVFEYRDYRVDYIDWSARKVYVIKE